MKTFQNFFAFLICISVLFVFQSKFVVANTMNSNNGEEVQSVSIIQATGRISKVTPQRGAMYKVYILVEDNGNLPSEIEIGLQRYVKTSAANRQGTAVGVLGARPSNSDSDPQSTAVGVLGATIDKLARQGTNVVIYESARPQRTTQNGLQVGDTKEIKLSSDVIQYSLGDATNSRRPLTCAYTVCGDWGCMCKIEMEQPW